MAAHSMPSVNRWLARLCESLPDCRSGLASRSARPGSRAALGGPAGLLGAPREATTLVREPTTAAILVSSPASCRGRHHGRVSVQATAMLGKYSLDHVGQSGLGSAGPLFAGPGIAAGRQPFGVDERLCVGGVVIRPCLLRKFAFLQLSSC